MKKRVLSILLAICMGMSLLPGEALAQDLSGTASGTCGENLKWSLENGTLTISGVGKMIDYDDSYIQLSPWRWNQTIRNVIIENGITNIGAYAFYALDEITDITIPTSVTSIGEGAFSGCTGLSNITIPNSVLNIGYRAFNGCSNLKSAGPMGGGYGYEFDWTDRIPANAFSGCSGLSSITIPGTVLNIGLGAFDGCNNLKSAGPVGGGYGYEFGWKNKIPSLAFADCRGLTEIALPEGITSIGDYAFSDCHSLVNIDIPKNVTDIGTGAFCACYDLCEITIPNGVMGIKPETFNGCEGLRNISIPNSITSIGDCAFSDCSGMSSIKIPGTVTNIGEKAFSGCSGLNSITIPDSVTSIGKGAFSGCSGLSKVPTIPDGITVIGDEMFSNCSNLTNVTIPSTFTSIGNGSFSGCSGLTDLIIPPAIMNIGSRAFANCNNLRSAVIPNGISCIKDETFRGCGNLTSITIPDSVTRIEYYAFGYCDSLKDIYYSGSEVTWAKIFIESDGSIYGGNKPLRNATIHYAGAEQEDPGSLTQDELKEQYIQEHIDYYESSYADDIVPMETIAGLDFMLDDAKSDFSIAAYKHLSIAQGSVSMLQSFLDIKSYVDLSLGDGKVVSLKIPDDAVLDIGSSEYSVILYELMASDSVYNGIADTFSTEYEKNLRSFAKSISDKAIELAKSPNEDSFKAAEKALKTAAETIRTADPDSEEFADAFKTFERLAEEFLDVKKAKGYLENLSSVAQDSFTFLDSVFGELDSIGKAYQYACWAESYAKTDAAFKTVLRNLADKAEKRAKMLQLTESGADAANPYSESRMCLGLSKAIDSFISTMEKYAIDSHKEFQNEVLNKTGDSFVNLVVGFLGDLKKTKNKDDLTGSINTYFKAINTVLSTGKRLIDLFTDIDEEHKLALSVQSLRLICLLMKDVSNDYGHPVLIAPDNPDPLSTQFDWAMKFDKSIKIYKNALLLACEYAEEYEQSKLVHNAKLANLVPDRWYDSGATTPWQKKVSRASSALACIAFQKKRISDIHCHEDGLRYDSVTGLIQYGESSKIVTVACPVEVTVKDPEGKQIAYLSDESVTVAPGYEPYFFVVPSDGEYIKAALVPDEENYSISIKGTDEGNMNVLVGRYKENAIHEVETFANFPVTAGTTGCLDSGDRDNSLGYLTLGSGDDTKGYAVTFYANGGAVNPALIMTEGDQKISNLPVPTRYGFAFDGWFTATDGGEEVDGDKIYTKNTALYAHWTRIRPLVLKLDTMDAFTEIVFDVPKNSFGNVTQVIAARYEEGRMTEAVSGTGLPGEEPVKFPAKIEWNRDWKIFFLHSEDNRPLCGPLVLTQ